MDKKEISKQKNKTSKKINKKNLLEEQLANEKDNHLRLLAEFDNFRKRTARERIDLFSSANKEIITELLPVLDNFERAIKDGSNKSEGVVLIHNQLKSILEKKGLKEIDNPIGKVLDTTFHEAVTNIPVASKKQKGKIVDVVEKGYMVGEKIIRYTKVVVGN